METKQGKRGWGIVLILSGAIWLVHLVFILFADIRKLLIYLPDDAFYYFKIAENISAGLGSTFDSLHRTNGYQPLWLGLLVIINSILDYSPEVNARLYLFIQLIIISFAGIILTKTILRKMGYGEAAISSLLFIVFVFTQSINGMETPLVVFLFIVFICYQQKLNPFLQGLLLGLLFLARLDMIFFIGVYFASLLYTELMDGASDRTIIKKLWNGKVPRLAAGFLLISLPYLLFNLYSFGHLQPINGFLKSSFPIPVINLGFQLTIFGWLLVSTALPAAIIYLLYNKRIKRDTFFKLLSITAVSILLHFGYHIFFTTWEKANWYFIYSAVFLSILAAQIYHGMPRGIKLKLNNIVLPVLFIVFGAMLFYRSAKHFKSDNYKTWHGAAYDAALWLKDAIKENETVASADAGIISYFSERRVINLDGLVNDFDFQEVLNNSQLNHYFMLNKVKYITFVDTTGSLNYNKNIISVQYISYQYKSLSDKIYFTENDFIYIKPYGNKKKSFLIINYNP